MFIFFTFWLVYAFAFRYSRPYRVYFIAFLRVFPPTNGYMIKSGIRMIPIPLLVIINEVLYVLTGNFILPDLRLYAVFGPLRN